MLFKIKRLKTDEEKEEARRLVASFDENDGVESWGFFKFAAAMLVLFILTIATTSVLPGISSLGDGLCCNVVRSDHALALQIRR